MPRCGCHQVIAHRTDVPPRTQGSECAGDFAAGRAPGPTALPGPRTDEGGDVHTPPLVFAADRKASRACPLGYFISAVILSMITFGVA
jgi:hypothetical protein